MKMTLLSSLVLLGLVALYNVMAGSDSILLHEFYGPFGLKELEAQLSKRSVNDVIEPQPFEYSPVYVGPQDGLKEAAEILMLPGQPTSTSKIVQYSGYVTVDPTAGRALFSYFVELAENSSTKPLVLW
ncbi:hypothetical protein LguiB_007107 [Lonicera macranthoides]